MASKQPTLLCRYCYDPLDRLINQNQPDVPAHQCFYCKSRLATEIQGAMQHSILQHGDLLLAQQQRNGDEVSATLLSTDQQRSVLHTLGKTGQRQAIAYSPYGYRGAEHGLTSLLGFNGVRLDPVTGCYILGNGYRAFNLALMRFNNPDNLSPFGKGGLNPYAYCLGDPINRIDPNGHVSRLLLWKTKLTRSVVYQDFTRKIAPDISAEEALKGIARVRELDELIHKENIPLSLRRSDKIMQDRWQLVKKSMTGEVLTTRENKRYVIQNLIYNDSGTPHFSYRDLKTLKRSSNTKIPDRFKTMISEVFPHATDSANLVTNKDIHGYLKNDIKLYSKEIKEINSSIRKEYKSERRKILDNHFLPPFVE